MLCWINSGTHTCAFSGKGQMVNTVAFHAIQRLHSAAGWYCSATDQMSTNGHDSVQKQSLFMDVDI